MSTLQLIFMYLLVYCVTSGTNTCSNDGYPYEVYLSTKTPYRKVSNSSFAKMNYEGCHPKKIWMIVRHGTRYLNKIYIALMKTRLKEIRDLILNSTNVPNGYVKNRDLDLFRKWNVTVDNENDRKLTPEGAEEMLLLAERMQSRFPDLFDSSYSNSTYKFKSTRAERTRQSAYFFAAGLFGKANARDVWFPQASKADRILRFYTLCDKWKSYVKDTAKAHKEKEDFKKGAEMNRTVDNVNRRLGFQGVLKFEDVSLMHRICSYETAWNKRTKSPWCSVFSIEDFKVFEYGDDLKYYWQDGYGIELAYKQACLIFSDMNNFMKLTNVHPKVSAYFTHSGTLLKMMAHIGLNKDQEHLTANNYAVMGNRKFRTSKIDTFATNMAFVLFRCGSEDKLLTLFQEHIVRIPACPDSDLCELSKLKEYYFESIENCDFDSICKVN